MGRWSLAIAVVCVGFRGVSYAESSPDSAAATLVQSALEAELAGDAAARAERLARAKQSDPQLAAARWHSGEVYYDRAWRTLPEIQSLVAQDDRRAQYAERRSLAADDPQDHAELAEWCDRKGLAAQARYHWTQVLLDDPTDKRARRALGLLEYADGLYTADEIAAKKRAAKLADESLARHRPILAAWLREGVLGGPSTRAAVLARIRNVTDPAALGALEEAVFLRPAHRRGPLARMPRGEAESFRRELELAVLAAADRMPQFEATLWLVNYAVFGEREDVRQRAAQALRPRQATDYVPLLMSALRAPLVVDVDMETYGEDVVLSESVRQAGPLSDTLQRRETGMSTVRVNPSSGNVIDFIPTYRRQLSQQAAVTLAAVEAANADFAAVNERVLAVLNVTTDGVELGSHPQVWWQAWQDYNELFVPDGIVVEEVETAEFTNYTMSCFIAGTPVWTDAGPTPIEQIRPGDVVLSQDVETGELSFQPVLETTIRPPSPLMQVDVDDDAIVATRGHRFWVDGQGWEMAKFLKPQMRLHAFDGGKPVTSIRPFDGGKDLDAYNLVVEGFHTYFVGQSRLLVLDNTCPRPTLVKAPGMKPRAASTVSKP